ncbi:hypothetical protein B0T14DRAFT_563228 [Immersiella caudata]|uniref:Uncharacterized protein n=1 Tax=Immersiella caudata TaxID=314043 RepID=A0AA39X501_9PEZI|nr:hypothetical protein B0T14DRAFT_563228 [Immersiella caudata]
MHLALIALAAAFAFLANAAPHTPHTSSTRALDINPSNIVLILDDSLPTLASLNITAADLYNMNPDLSLGDDNKNTSTSPGSVHAPKVAHCATGPMTPYRRDLAQTCVNYFSLSGNRDRLVPASDSSVTGTPCVRLCTAKDNTPGSLDWAAVGVRAVNGKKESKSLGQHVAWAVEQVVKLCDYPGDKDDKLAVAGYEFAWGNGDFRVDVAGEIGTAGEGDGKMCKA